jgi:hypothetical protein
MRVNQGQEFVIGGYTAGGATFDALIFGYYDGPNLIYAARTRNGFTPPLRVELMRKSAHWKSRHVESELTDRRGDFVDRALWDLPAVSGVTESVCQSATNTPPNRSSMHLLRLDSRNFRRVRLALACRTELVIHL